MELLRQLLEAKTLDLTFPVEFFSSISLSFHARHSLSVLSPLQPRKVLAFGLCRRQSWEFQPWMGLALQGYPFIAQL
jgi:hypothetical protein